MRYDINLILLALLTAIAILHFVVALLRKSYNYSSDFKTLNEDIKNNATYQEDRLRTEFSTNRSEYTALAKNNQEQLFQQLQRFSENQSTLLNSFQKQLKDNTDSGIKQFQGLRENMAKSIGDMRNDVNKNLGAIQEDNNKQLEKMRITVDEKLHKTLEDRLGKSFELVSNHLKAVQQGLGEMKKLASGVGDLKKVLSNVKTRGVLGEIQLGNILEQLLSKEQYGINVATIPNSRAHVEFAIKMPGKDDGNPVWLPIDSKFPMDRYEQLVDAYDEADSDKIQQSKKALRNTIKAMAKDIKEKYIAPPFTTNFGILFLPTEGLYAEVARDGDLLQAMQRDYKIMIAGPTNLAALLNSLQMGFRSLAIEKRSSEVWKILASVKTEFGKFGGVLDKVQKKLSEASNTIDKVGVRSRAIERNLREVEELPSVESKQLPFDDGVDLEDLQLPS